MIRRLGGDRSSAAAPTREKGPEFYQQSFQANPDRRKHYTESPYYPLWTVIVDRLRSAHARAVLEVGCGSGQLAWAIDDAKILTSYCGFDFTGAMVEQARRNCPHMRFEVSDACSTDLFETCHYDTVLATEFLEHVEDDLRVVRSIRNGARFIGTVPNFPYVSHVRHFSDATDVAARYRDMFSAFRVDAIPANDKGKTFFLIEGMRRGG